MFFASCSDVEDQRMLEFESLIKGILEIVLFSIDPPRRRSRCLSSMRHLEETRHDQTSDAGHASIDELKYGPDRDRTGDLLNAIQARSQLRYRPTQGKTIFCSTPQPACYARRRWVPTPGSR